MNIRFGTKGSNKARALELMRKADGCDWITEELAKPVLDLLDDSVFINDPMMHGGSAHIAGGRDDAHRAALRAAFIEMMANANKPNAAAPDCDEHGKAYSGSRPLEAYEEVNKAIAAKKARQC